jgi:hypothetical protein
MSCHLREDIERPSILGILVDVGYSLEQLQTLFPFISKREVNRMHSLEITGAPYSDILGLWALTQIMDKSVEELGRRIPLDPFKPREFLLKAYSKGVVFDYYQLKTWRSRDYTRYIKAIKRLAHYQDLEFADIIPGFREPILQDFLAINVEFGRNR